MKLAPIAIVSAALVGLNTPSWAATFEAVPGLGATTEFTTVVNSFLTPVATAGSSVASYSVLSTAAGFPTSGTISFAAPVTSFTFLWGSPDSYNRVTDGTVTVTGSTFSSGTGNNAETTLYTFFDALGFSSLTFSTTGIAFELAVASVPEPETYAMMLAGLGAVGFLALRRKRK
jgi:hypothetical protein